MTNRSQRRSLKRKFSRKDQHDGTLFDSTAVTLGLLTWNRDHPGELPPLVARKRGDTIAAYSDRIWRALVHQKAGPVALADVCLTCKTNPIKEKR